jgi:hypothetical protein
MIAPPVLATLVWWYVFYAPRNLPLPLPPSFLSIWLVPFIHYGTAHWWVGQVLRFCLRFFLDALRTPQPMRVLGI